MARAGPNQDINDPTTIIDLTYQYQQDSVDKGNLLAQFNAQDSNVSGSPIVDISIPFKKIDGSTELLEGSDISYDGSYSYDTNLVANSTLVTYINLAERFRDYWETLNDVLDQIDDFATLEETSLAPDGPYYTSGSASLFEYGSLGGITWTETEYTHSPSGSMDIPTWSGFGPINYNQNTYPQLLNELSNINMQRSSSSSTTWDTNYKYYKYEWDYLSVPFVFGIGKEISFGGLPPTPGQEGYIQFYNSGPSSISISLALNAAGTFTLSGVVFDCSAFVASVAEIKDRNDFPTGNPDDQPSYQFDRDQILSGGGSVSASGSRIITIPSGQSAFIYMVATASANFDPSFSTIDLSITLEDKGLTYSH